METSPVKKLVLETLWTLDKPAKAAEIAKESGVAFPSIMMHLIGLTRMGYAESPKKGVYTITANGKKALGMPEITVEKASEILRYVPMEKAFQFYADIGKPLNIYATSLQDFCDKLLTIDLSSIEFHVGRGDFETWFTALGDVELARKTSIIKKQKMLGKELRARLYEIVGKRCEELAKTKKEQ